MLFRSLMLYQLSYSRGDDLVVRNYAKEPDYQLPRPVAAQPRLWWLRMKSTMATPPPLPPTTSRLVGMLLILSGGLLGVGLLLKVAIGVYAWNTAGMQSPSALLLSVNLVGLLASGLLMRWGLRMRRGTSVVRDPKANEIL